MTDSPSRVRLDSAQPFEESCYREADLAGLAAYTLDWLQRQNTPTTFENVVVAAFKMFPAKFSLEGYPSYPDAARVGRTLLQLGPKYRNWARGSVQKGFVLTQTGLSKVKSVQEQLAAASSKTAPQVVKRSVTPRTMDLAKELTSLES